jgi:hypothetical protein
VLFLHALAEGSLVSHHHEISDLTEVCSPSHTVLKCVEFRVLPKFACPAGSVQITLKTWDVLSSGVSFRSRSVVSVDLVLTRPRRKKRNGGA